MCVDDERPPFADVMLAGTAEIDDDLDELRRRIRPCLCGARPQR
jgi:hypothetical protein